MNIIICLPDMYLGGTEIVLLEMLSNMKDYDNLNITLGLINNEGQLIKKVPNFVEIKKLPLLCKDVEVLTLGGTKNVLSHEFQKGKFFRVLKVLLQKIIGDELAILKSDFDSIPNLDQEYDLAISYQMHNVFITRYVAEKIVSKKKVLWTHNDLETTKLNTKYYNDFIENYDKIYTVSNQIEMECKKAWPNMDKKITTFYNFIDEQKITLKSKEEINDKDFNKEKITIISVGRLTKQKGFDLGISAMHLLKEVGYDFNWFIIGDGEEKSKLKKLIKNNGLEENVYLLGSKMNPYKYMVNSDIYFQPSRHEGYATTTNEARVLGIPIITTNVSGAQEQIKHNFNGLICEISSLSMFESLKELIEREDLRIKFRSNLKSIDFNKSSKVEFKKLLQLNFNDKC